MNNYMNNNTKGFTLLEVMISILVIGIIASIVIVNNMDASKGKADMAKLKSQWVINEGKYVEKLVGKWSFDEGSGTAANDSSTFGRNGTIVGAVWKDAGDCIEGKCLEFNGSSRYITLPTIDISNTISVSAWAYSSNFNQNGFIVGKNPVNTQWELFFEGQYVRWRGGAPTNNNVSCPKPEDNKWHYFVGVQNGTSASLYVDGKMCASSSSVVAIGNGTGSVEIGRFSSNYYFNGRIDEVSIYNSVMTLSEIRGNYVAGLNKMLAKELITEEDYEERLVALNDGLVAED